MSFDWVVSAEMLAIIASWAIAMWFSLFWVPRHYTVKGLIITAIIAVVIVCLWAGFYVR